MSELSVRQYLHNDGSGLTWGYDKREADKVIADLEESHKMEVEQLLILNREQANAANRLRDNMEQTLRRQKKNRCLAMARWCHNQKEIYERDSYNWELEDDAKNTLRNKANIMRKWRKRWLAIAEKFKTNSTKEEVK